MMPPSRPLLACVAAAHLMFGASPAAAQKNLALIDDAIAAQDQGLGGCRGPWSTDTITSRLFMGVTFLRAKCTREHGEAGEAYVGLDGRGLVHLLASPTAFDFLRRVSRPSPPQIDDLVPYALEALSFWGLWVPGGVSVAHREDLPAAVRRRTTLGTASLARVDRTPGGRYRIVVHALSPSLLMRYDLLVTSEGAILTMAARTLWSVTETR